MSFLMIRTNCLLAVCLTINCFFLSSRVLAAQVPSLHSLTICISGAGISNFTTPSAGATFYSFLTFSLQNLRFTEAGTPSPDLIVIPQSPSQVQNAFLCSVKWGYQVRIRSGGHCYEGLSSQGSAGSPFIIIDLMNLNSVSIDLASKTAWVEAGATLGEIYYSISQASPNYGFPAGVCPTVGSGGHISGGGYGFLSRKYGTAADNVLDASIVDVGGRLLNRASMGEDLFWALRGGGGGSWGIVVAWKIQLVSVTPVVTTFRTWRTGKSALSELIYRWQWVAPVAPQELFHAVYMAGTTSGKAIDVGASFYGQYLGTMSETLALMNKIYPELNLSAADCKEGRWIEGVANIAGVTNVETLTSRDNRPNKGYFKAKSDYVRQQLSKDALMGAFSKLEANAGKGYMIFEPYGGIMDTIGSGTIAFPHRSGTLYNIQYMAVWNDDAQGAADAPLIAWIRDLHSYMTKFVSQSPRAAYINYIDLDLGTQSTIAQAEVSWGQSYFLSNFPRLAHIKGRIDPFNVFNHPQSIPPNQQSTIAFKEGCYM